MSNWSHLNDIDLVLWIATHPAGDPHPSILVPETAQGFADAMSRLGREGIIAIDKVPVLAPRGQAWLDMILATPMPVMLWVDPRNAMPASRLTPVNPALLTKDDIRSLADLHGVGHYLRSPDEVEKVAREAMPETVANLSPPKIPDGYTLHTDHDSTAVPNGVPGNQFLHVIRRNGQAKLLYAASVNWKTRGKPDDVVAYIFAEEPEESRKAHVGNSPKSGGAA